MAHEDQRANYDINLRAASSAGEPLNPEVIAWVNRIFDCSANDHYGQTETGIVSANFHALEHKERNACMGYPLPGYRLVALDSEMNEVDPGETGELAIDIEASPQLFFQGYTWGEKNPYKGKYYLTGDIVISNGDGSHSYTGRDDDIISSAGYRIGPADVESTLLEHPAVNESAVVGKPDKKRGSIVKAYVVIKPEYEAEQGNCVVLKPAEQTPASILVMLEIVGDILPPGVLNVVNGYGKEAGEALATSKRIVKIAFTGSTPVGGHILKCAAENIILSTVELGGKSPNVYFEDIFNHDDDYLSKCVEGAVLAYFNQGEVCSCPSRLLIQESIYPKFIEMVIERTKLIKRGNPLDVQTMVGAQASKQQQDKILSYLEIGKKEGAEILMGGEVENLGEDLSNGYYIKPTLFKGDNSMRVFQEEIFGPVISACTFKDEAEALAIANDTEFGLGAGVWSRDMKLAYRMGRGIKAGRVWTNYYHMYPAHAAFGGYKKSGVGRETHKMALEHYQQTKNMLVSYDVNPLGFF